MSHDECADQLGPTPPRKNGLIRFAESVYNMFDKPVTWFRENVVESNRPPYPYYHMRLKRVPTIDQCYTDDIVCVYEANQQFLRDRAVETEITNILRIRVDDCLREEYPDWERCKPMQATFDEAAANWFAKYGDMGAHHSVITAFMKQKHRMIWERRHGKVGSGMKCDPYEVEVSGDGHH